MNEVCIKCGAGMESWDTNYYSRGMMCPSCYSDSARRTADKTAICTRCGIRFNPKDANLKLGTTLCQKCYEEEVSYKKEHFCVTCGKKIEGARFERPDGFSLCLRCMQDQSPSAGKKSAMRVCDACGRQTLIWMVTKEGQRLCAECAERSRSRSFLGRITNALLRMRK